MTDEGTYYGGSPSYIKYTIALFHFTITLMGSVVSFFQKFYKFCFGCVRTTNASVRKLNATYF